jgi:hypothetical protein
MKMKEIKKILKQIELLCQQNEFGQVGELSRKHKPDFIEMIKNGDNQTLLYAYQVCEYFNMSENKCYEVKYTK